MVGRPPGRLLARGLALLRGGGRRAGGTGALGRHRHRPRAHGAARPGARPALVSWSPAQLRREPPPARRRAGRRCLLERAWPAAAPELPGAQVGGRRGGDGIRRARRWPGRPGGRLSPQSPRDRHRDARRGEPRRGLVVVLARFRRQRRAGPVRADPPQAPDLRRRVPLRRKGSGLTRALARGARPDSRDRARDRGPVPSPCARHLRHPRRHPVGPAPGRPSRSRASLLCPPALRPSAVHHVLVRHHGRAQVHGARRGGHAAPASEGAGAAHRPR